MVYHRIMNTVPWVLGKFWWKCIHVTITLIKIRETLKKSCTSSSAFLLLALGLWPYLGLKWTPGAPAPLMVLTPEMPKVQMLLLQEWLLFLLAVGLCHPARAAGQPPGVMVAVLSIPPPPPPWSVMLLSHMLPAFVLREWSRWCCSNTLNLDLIRQLLYGN